MLRIEPVERQAIDEDQHDEGDDAPLLREPESEWEPSQVKAVQPGGKEDSTFNFNIASRKLVRAINGIIVFNSRRYLIARDNTLLEHLIKWTKIHNWYKAPKLFAK